MDLPQTFIDMMTEILGHETEAFLASYDQKRHYGLRMNPLKDGLAAVDKLPFTMKDIPWCSSGYYYGEEDRPAKNPLYAAGCYYIQEPSAMTSGAALEAKPGETVIDLCAAPGGKSTQIAGAMAGQGLLVSNDISPSRVKNLNKNIQLSGIRNALVISEDPVKLADRWPEVFDRVLVDAPCSGEGMFRKEPKLVSSWLQSGPEDFIDVQRQILEAAYKLLAPGGRLVYSTCTYNLEENEGNVAWLMAGHSDMILENAADMLGIGHGMAYDGRHELEMCGRVWPHRQESEGHFVAVMTKLGETEQAGKNQDKGSIDKEALEAFTAFAKDVGIAHEVLPLDRLNRIKDTIYLLPPITLPTKGLRIFADGWLLGTMKRGRFEPSQAFASGLRAKEVHAVVAFSHDDMDAVRYLKGETIGVDKPTGWHLVAVEGQGIGWGKVVGKRLKNKLEPNWRWQ